MSRRWSSTCFCTAESGRSVAQISANTSSHFLPTRRSRNRRSGARFSFRCLLPPRCMLIGSRCGACSGSSRSRMRSRPCSRAHPRPPRGRSMITSYMSQRIRILRPFLARRASRVRNTLSTMRNAAIAHESRTEDNANPRRSRDAGCASRRSRATDAPRVTLRRAAAGRPADRGEATARATKRPPGLRTAIAGRCAPGRSPTAQESRGELARADIRTRAPVRCVRQRDVDGARERACVRAERWLSGET